jgi:hypothetical protein
MGCYGAGAEQTKSMEALNNPEPMAFYCNALVSL